MSSKLKQVSLVVSGLIAGIFISLNFSASAGKDEATAKSTYPSLLGLDASKAEADRLTKEAIDALDVFGEDADRLREIAGYMLDRTH